MRSLSAECDVLVENFIPGKLEALGLGFDDLSRLRRPGAPGLVYCSVTGFGPEGPYAERPGYDVIAASLGIIALLLYIVVDQIALGHFFKILKVG